MVMLKQKILTLHNIKSSKKEIHNVIFYHHPCMDGSVSAWAALQALGTENTEYIGINHDDGNILETCLLYADAHVYFCDISPLPSILEKLLDVGHKVSIYDHHITSHKHLKNFSHPNCEIVLDMNRSGAGLSWDIFNKGKTRPFLIDLVEAMDLANSDFMSTPEEFFTLAAGVDTFDNSDFEQFSKEISELVATNDTIRILEERGLKQRKIYIKRINIALDEMKPISCKGIQSLGDCKVGFVWRKVKYLSREFWYQFEKQSSYEPKIFMACKYDPDHKMVSLSLRSDNDIDVSSVAEEIATKYGINGGGHANSAAVRFTHEQFSVLIDKWQLPNV